MRCTACLKAVSKACTFANSSGCQELVVPKLKKGDDMAVAVSCIRFNGDEERWWDRRLWRAGRGMFGVSV